MLLHFAIVVVALVHGHPLKSRSCVSVRGSQSILQSCYIFAHGSFLFIRLQGCLEDSLDWHPSLSSQDHHIGPPPRVCLQCSTIAHENEGRPAHPILVSFSNTLHIDSNPVSGNSFDESITLQVVRCTS